MLDSKSLSPMAPNPNIKALGLDIKVHLCKHCVNRFASCSGLQYVYGSGEGEREGVPNVCACEGFDPSVVIRRAKPESPRAREPESPRAREPESVELIAESVERRANS